jgi:hypothetical protein
MSRLRPYVGKDELLSRVAVLRVALTPVYAALAALLLHPGAALGGLLVGCFVAIGAMIGRRYRFRDCWALPPAHRHLTMGAALNGKTTAIRDSMTLLYAYSLTEHGGTFPRPASTRRTCFYAAARASRSAFRLL